MGGSKQQNSTKQNKPTEGTNHPCKKCVKYIKEGRPHDENDGCDEPTSEPPNGAVEEEPKENRNRLPPNQYKRYKNKIKKQKINVVFNYSNIVLTEAMDKV